MADPTASQDPSDGGAASPDASGDGTSGGGYTIEISVADDGTITVGVESANHENAEASGGTG